MELETSYSRSDSSTRKRLLRRRPFNNHKICPKAIDPNFQTNQKESNLTHEEKQSKSGQTIGETSLEISIDIVAENDRHGVIVNNS